MIVWTINRDKFSVNNARDSLAVSLVHLRLEKREKEMEIYLNLDRPVIVHKFFSN